MMGADICMCGDVPADANGVDYDCPDSDIKIRCTPALDTIVTINVSNPIGLEVLHSS